MKNILLYTIISLITLSSYSQNIKKGYKALEKLDYEKALESFKKDIDEDKTNPGANFGLALLYADKNYSGNDITKTWEYSLVVKENVNSLTTEDSEVLGEYFFNMDIDKSSRPVKKKVNNKLADFEIMLIRYIREENNLDLAVSVIEKFPDFHYFDNVVHIRNHLEYRKAEKQNTFDAYETFLKTFPTAAQVPKAIKNRNTLAFTKAKQINTIASYEEFLKTYPKAMEANKALLERNRLAFAAAKQENTIEALVKFIYAYPDALEFAQAKNLIKKLVYDKAKDIKTIEAYNNFIRQYPSGEMYIDIFNLKSIDLGQSYLETHNDFASYCKWARMYDNMERLDITGGSAFIGDNGILIAANTAQTDSTEYTDAWLVSVGMDGKMLWNKQFGSYVTDIVYDFKEDRLGNFYGVGYTNSVNDTTPGKAWVFKIDKDGKKIWNRTIEALVATSLVINSTNQVIINGFKQKNDSTFQHYVLKLNEKGRKLWERTYIDNYFGLDIDITATDDMLITTSNWVYMIDQQGYIKWESKFDSTYQVMKGAINPSTGIAYISGVKDSTDVFVISIATTGKIMKETHVGKLVFPQVYDIEFATNSLLLGAPFTDGNDLLVINPDLTISKTFDLLPEDYQHNKIDFSKGSSYIGISTSMDDILYLLVPLTAF